jgi:hypothetical protein
MQALIRLGVGASAGAVSMLLVLGTLENQVNWRRMLFIGAFCGIGTAGVLETVGQRRKILSPIEALTLQLSRLDLPPSEAVAIAEQLGKLHSLTDRDIPGADSTQHPTPDR